MVAPSLAGWQARPVACPAHGYRVVRAPFVCVQYSTLTGQLSIRSCLFLWVNQVPKCQTASHGGGPHLESPEMFFMVYTRYILYPRIRQKYSWYIPRICFPNKILFSSIRIQILLWWVCAVYKTILLRDEESILQCYMMVKRTVGYDWNIPCLCMVYAWYIHQIGFIDLFLQRKWWYRHHELKLACTDHYSCWGHNIITQSAVFIQHEYL